MEKEIKFSKELIKGKIAEVIFEQMIRDEKRYTVIPFGYEYTMPMLAQYQHHFTEIKHIIENISEAPDFVLISEDLKSKNKPELYLVEVKYRQLLDMDDIKAHAQKLLDRWNCPWLFIATPKGFFCGMCKWIINENKINLLGENWVIKERQQEYIKLLQEFEK